jgi:hypothetical protein
MLPPKDDILFVDGENDIGDNGETGRGGIVSIMEPLRSLAALTAPLAYLKMGAEIVYSHVNGVGGYC